MSSAPADHAYSLTVRFAARLNCRHL